MADSSEQIKSILKTLPDKPGVYQYFNNLGEIIYVGKAKSLRKRVTSYFLKAHDSSRTNMLVRKINDIKYIVVDTELDALLLENNFIKKYQPRYNVLLKDDKTYPWICVKNEPFPRVFSTRKIIKDGSLYFGPYANVKMVHTLLDLVKHLYPLRNCNLALNKENIEKGKFKVCLEYHIGNCKGPCEARQLEPDYNDSISNIKEILKGNINIVIQHLNDLLKKFAAEYAFEKAHVIKEKIELLENFKSKSIVVHPGIHNVDVFSIISDENYGFVNFFKIINGAIIQSHTLEMKKKLDETDEELLSIAITELRSRFNSDSKEIIVPFTLDIALPGIEYTVPRIGDKKHLLNLSEKNVKYYMNERLVHYDKLDPEHRVDRLMELMKKELRLCELPRHIECFDNSNIQGAFPVAAMTVFINGRPAKKEYRHFNIKTVEGPDDFASMEEIIFRRYKRMLDEQQRFPQLIVIDGGKGQLSAALKSLEKLGLRGKIGIIGIAKRLEEIYYPNDPVPMYLDKKSETLKVIQQIRDEAHRFGITHHRNKRSKAVIKTALSDIAGIGPSTSDALLKHFKSVDQIKKATIDEISTAIGNSKAKIVWHHFNKDMDQN
jgi:excinuclease ABC subunit C